MEFDIPENLSGEAKYVVTENDLAKFLGSGNVNVLATPRMISWIEKTARIEIDKYLPEGYTTVGYRVDVYHLNPAPLGAEVVVKFKLRRREGRKLILDVEVYWGDVKIGEGVHERYIVNLEKFRKKVEDLTRSVK